MSHTFPHPPSPIPLPPSLSALRREFGTDEILDEPQPFFDLIKECYPSWYCGQGKSGDPVYWERCVRVCVGGGGEKGGREGEWSRCVDVAMIFYPSVLVL